ncbi:MAG: DUF1800 family protein [Kiritimatiellaeota bacterium]|nr:DUF1800 family protein [Kiritimatiellota bacterium]
MNQASTDTKQDRKAALDPQRAWARYEPDARRPWTLALAGHLYRRAAFGASWPQLQRALSDGPQKTLDGLLRPATDVAAFNRQFDEFETPPGDDRNATELRAWWLQRMIRTPHPLLERLTLFWSGHCAANNTKVESGPVMQRHLQLLRRHALGDFRAVLIGLVGDTAMFATHNAKANRKALPSPGFPRWLLEAHLGTASEQDVRNAARAFTGWFIYSDELRYIEREHDAGAKKILGQEGNFGADDVARLVATQPATAATIVRKLYRWLIAESAEPDAALLAPLVTAYAKDYDTLALAETMLRSNLFFWPEAYRQRVKSPVEYALGIIMGLETSVSTQPLADALAGIGQNLLHPPTSKGWTGGRDWLNPATVAGRLRLADALLRGGPYIENLNLAAVAQKNGQPVAPFFAKLYLQDETLPGHADAHRAAYAVVSQPEFQLA